MVFATVSRSMADILDPVPAVPEEEDMKTSESINTVPLALPLASPERSSLDEEHFNVSNQRNATPTLVLKSFEALFPRWQHRT